MCRAFKRMQHFRARQLQRLEFLRQLRILVLGFARTFAIMLELFHALLNSSFVIDESFARIAHADVPLSELLWKYKRVLLRESGRSTYRCPATAMPALV